MGMRADVKLEQAERAAFNSILVIEDDDDTREMLVVCIESETPYRVISFSDTEEVFRRL